MSVLGSVRNRRGLPAATLIWFDPGDTTGLALVSISPEWLAGEGSPSWQGLKLALQHVWIAQVGKDTRVWSDGHAVETMAAVRSDDDTEEMLRELEPYQEIQRETFVVTQCTALLAPWPSAAWGHESFELREISANLSPLRINAKVAHHEVVYGDGRLPYAQTASYAKTTATDTRLQLAGLYRAGIPHGTDAARHCATFLRDCRKDSWLRAEAWPHLFES